MPASDLVVVILAAGKGTRLKSSLAKVLHRAGGRTLVEHVVRASQPLRPRSIVVVVGHQAAEVSAAVEPLGARTVLQEPQRGTGHAVLVARKAIGHPKFLLVVPGDSPLVRPETLAALVRAHRQSGAAATILSAEIPDPTGYGRIVRKEDGSVAAIVEDSAANEEQRAIHEINSSTYCFHVRSALAVPRATEAGEQAQGTLSDGRDRAAAPARAGGPSRSGHRCGRSAGMQHARRSGGGGRDLPASQTRITDGGWRDDRVAGDRADRSGRLAGPDTIIEPCVQLLEKN